MEEAKVFCVNGAQTIRIIDFVLKS